VLFGATGTSSGPFPYEICAPGTKEYMYSAQRSSYERPQSNTFTATLEIFRTSRVTARLFLVEIVPLTMASGSSEKCRIKKVPASVVVTVAEVGDGVVCAPICSGGLGLVCEQDNKKPQESTTKQLRFEINESIETMY